MRWITLGGPAFLVGLIALRWWSREQRPYERHLAIACGISTAFGLLINQAILLFYHRPRPYDAGITRLIVERSADPSFPSDHATVGFAIAASLLFSRDRRFVSFFILSLLICISRIFVGTHYLTDILGGAATGALAAVFVAFIYGRLEPLTRRLVQIL